MLVSDVHSLEEYLERFVLTLSVMQDGDALERIAFELVEDHAREHVRYLEVRYCPALCTQGGLRTDEVMDHVLAGLRRAEATCDVRARVIVCGLRTLDPSTSVEMAEVAVAYKDRGVVAFDLAGAEAGNPAREHLEAFRLAEAGGLAVTVHAGEGFGAPSIKQAVHDAHATRIGHGTRLWEDAEIEALVRERGIPLEVCLTSNVQTGVAASYALHPVRRYFDQGIPLTLCTDNRLMSGVTLTREYEHARDHLGFTWAELKEVARAGFEAAYLPDEEKSAMLERVDLETSRVGS
jgi:adenosine deaminase